MRFVRANARIADFIDHTLLKAEATRAEVEKLCDEAREHRFAAVCVNPSWVKLCAERLKRSDVQVATVVGFPLGATSSAAKRRETELAVEQGATEIDMVAAIGHIKSGDWSYVADDI
ncbi:MAG: deoxyribose-phosphate aldolase, partial [Gemmatimonadaceae bacterium]